MKNLGVFASIFRTSIRKYILKRITYQQRRYMSWCKCSIRSQCCCRYKPPFFKRWPLFPSFIYAGVGALKIFCIGTPKNTLHTGPLIAKNTVGHKTKKLFFCIFVISKFLHESSTLWGSNCFNGSKRSEFNTSLVAVVRVAIIRVVVAIYRCRSSARHGKWQFCNCRSSAGHFRLYL